MKFNPMLGYFRCMLSIAILYALVANATNGSVWAQTAPAATEVGGPITSNTFWAAFKSPYLVVADVDVYPGVTLTIQAGTIVKFVGDYSITVEGELIAIGTPPDQGIDFISAKVPAGPGDWGGIYFTDTAITTTMGSNGNYIKGSIIQGCLFEFGGSANPIHPYVLSGVSLLVDGNTFYANKAGGVELHGYANSPARITNNDFSNNNGTTGGGVRSGNYTLVVNNSFELNKALFAGGAIYAQGSEIRANHIIGNTAYRGGGIDAHPGTLVINNDIKYNRAFSGGGISCDHCTVENNIIKDNNAPVFPKMAGGGGLGGGIYAEGGQINDNIIANNTAESLGGGILVNGGTVISNTIASNQLIKTPSISPRGSGALLRGAVVFSFNTVVDNQGPAQEFAGGIEYDPGSAGAMVHHNNLYQNKPYDAALPANPGATGVSEIDATQNYWGTNQSSNISKQIYDWNDDHGLMRLLYIPYLQEAERSAPVPPPLNLRGVSAPGTVHLAWDPVPDPAAGYGYKIYYAIYNSEPPYTGSGLPLGSSPIDVGSATSLTLTGLENDVVYYFAVTAYDNRGKEGWYSNMLRHNPVAGIYIYMPGMMNNAP
jgi:hypothetical protein